MRQVAACVPCYPRQVQSALEAAGADEETCYRVMEQLFPLILSLDRNRMPADNSTVVLLRAYELLGNDDPFKEARSETNRRAFGWLPTFEKMVQEAEDPLLMAVRVSAAGNIVDMGILSEFDLGTSMAEVEVSAFARFDYEELKACLAQARQVLVIGDNSGEIVLDRLLLAQLGQRGRRVLYSVKSSPILNDATLSDALEARLMDVAEVVETGSNYLGVVEGHYSEEFRQAMEESGLIIAKGQANYETLEGSPLAGDKTFFLLRAKCPVVAEHLGVPKMSPVLARNRSAKT